MEIRFNETRPVETRTRPDGTTVTVMPLSRRQHQVALLIGLALLPFFAGAPLVVESFSSVFTYAWVAAVCLFFGVYFWATGTYLFKADKYGLEVDGFGIREHLFARDYFWKWSDIESVEIQRVEAGKAIVLLLKTKSLKRKLRLAKFDVILQNQYAVSDSVILEHLLEHQEAAG